MTRRGSVDGEVFFMLGLFALVMCGACLFGGFCMGAGEREQYDEAKAVEAGVGEFVIVDAATGKSEFRFKKCGVK